MPLYLVRYTETHTLECEVEANSAEEAETLVPEDSAYQVDVCLSGVLEVRQVPND